MLEGLHAIRRKNRLPPSKNPENLEESVVLRRRNGAAPFREYRSGRPTTFVDGFPTASSMTWCCHQYISPDEPMRHHEVFCALHSQQGTPSSTSRRWARPR